MHEMKLGLLAGVREFERWERDMLVSGAQQMLAAVRALPDTLGRYFATVADIDRGDHQR